MKYVVYYRVSTQRQGKSGLGLEAQRTTWEIYKKPEDELVAEFIEVEKGRKNSRPELQKALVLANSIGAVLFIAKLDRLSRNAGFIFQLRDSQVDFVAGDIPEMNTLTVGVMAVVAQHETERIVQRIKEAFAEKRKRGEKMGTPENLTSEARLKGLEVRSSNAFNNIANRQSGELSVIYREMGMTLQAIADKLNENGYRTRYGKRFYPRTVKNLIERYTSKKE